MSVRVGGLTIDCIYMFQQMEMDFNQAGTSRMIQLDIVHDILTFSNIMLRKSLNTESHKKISNPDITSSCED